MRNPKTIMPTCNRWDPHACTSTNLSGYRRLGVGMHEAYFSPVWLSCLSCLKMMNMKKNKNFALEETKVHLPVGWWGASAGAVCGPAFVCVDEGAVPWVSTGLTGFATGVGLPRGLSLRRPARFRGSWWIGLCYNATTNWPGWAWCLSQHL